MLTLLVACLFHSRSSWTLQLLGIAHGKVVDGSIFNVQAISSQSWTCPASSWNPKLNITACVEKSTQREGAEKYTLE